MPVMLQPDRTGGAGIQWPTRLFDLGLSYVVSITSTTAIFKRTKT